MRDIIRPFVVISLVVLIASVSYAQRVRLRSQTNPNCTVGTGLNANWKYADIYADGNIAVQGSYYCRGVFIYDVSDPDHPVVASVYNPQPAQEFLEAIVVGNRGYFGTGSISGVHIVDLTDPYHPVFLGMVDPSHGNGFNTVHEMMVFDQGGARYLLENYNNTGTRPVRIINITDPANPVFKYEFTPQDNWVHAFHIRGNRLYTSGYSSGRIEIYDIGSLATQAPALIGQIIGTSTNHSSWTSEDGNYLYSCRETQNGDLRVYDVRDPAAPTLVRSMSTSQLGLNAVSPHNPVVMGNYLYVSWYQAGIQVFDLTDPTNPRRIGQYDTFSPTFAPVDTSLSESTSRLSKKSDRRVADAQPWDIICGGENVQNALPTNYDGNWAVFPFLGQDKILAGDLANGLIVLDATQVAAPLRNKAADFDGDRRTDISVFHPAAGSWQLENTSGSDNAVRIRLGTSGDEVVAGDYDGDGHADLAVFRPSTGEWFARKLRIRERGLLISGQYGLPNDIPVPGDYDADGRTDVALYRPSNMTFYIWQSTLGQKTVTLGNFGDRPVVGDYDGDGKADIAVWRPTTGAWVIQQSSSSIILNFTLGQSGDRPVSADFDGNGVTDLAVYRPSTGEWLVRDPMTGVSNTYVWGTAEDVAIPSDFDGDGRADLAVFRPSTNHWIWKNSSDGATVDRVFGQPGDLPVPLSAQPQ